MDWHWTGHYIIFFSLHFDLFVFLKWSLSMAKRGFFDVGRKLHFTHYITLISMDVRVNILNVVGVYVGLVK